MSWVLILSSARIDDRLGLKFARKGKEEEGKRRKRKGKAKEKERKRKGKKRKEEKEKGSWAASFSLLFYMIYDYFPL